MGLFSGLFKRDIEPSRLHSMKDHILSSFSVLKRDIDHHNKWISYLHKNLLDMKNAHYEHKYGSKSNIDKIHSNFDSINKWVDHLHSSNQLHNERIRNLEYSMKNAFDKYNQHIMDLFKLVHSKHEIIAKDLRKELKNELLLELQANMVEHRNYVKNNVNSMHSKLDGLSNEWQLNHKKVNERVDMHIDKVKKLHESVESIKQQPKQLKQSASEIKQMQQAVSEIQIMQPQAQPKPVEIVYNHTPLTNPEQKLLNILFSEPEPVSYSQLSNKTGHSVNTVRVNMNFLKKKGFIEENLLPNGVKLFNLKNKERIKKMYNVQHL
ncbi:MAG: winged helix-turn-helix transcriptional regulator [Candidatus Woesearchaeota archaeon]